MALPEDVPAAPELPRALAVTLCEMQHKKAETPPVNGRLTHLSDRWTRVSTDRDITLAGEVRIDIPDPATGRPASIYARVADADQQKDGHALWMRISYCPPEMDSFIERLSR